MLSKSRQLQFNATSLQVKQPRYSQILKLTKSTNLFPIISTFGSKGIMCLHHVFALTPQIFNWAVDAMPTSNIKYLVLVIQQKDRFPVEYFSTPNSATFSWVLDWPQSPYLHWWGCGLPSSNPPQTLIKILWARYIGYEDDDDGIQLYSNSIRTAC